MEQHGRYVIITKEEKEELRSKAREIYNYRDSEQINLRERLPYYIPTYRDFTMSGIPLVEKLPYYYFIMEKNENGEYMFENDNEVLNYDRSRLEYYYSPYIIVVESSEEIEEAKEYIRKQEVAQQ